MHLEEAIGYCEAIASGTLDGHLNALDSLAQLRAIKASAEDALKQIDELANTEASKYPNKTFEHGGLKFTRTEGRRTFKFDHIEEWGMAKKVVGAIEEQAKAAALQAEKGLGMHDREGMVIEAARIEYGKASISIVK